MGAARLTGHIGPEGLAQNRELYNREKYGSNNPRVNRLTPEQKQRIQELYGRGLSGNYIADKLSIGRTTVYKHLGLGTSRQPNWTDDEIQVLVDGYLEGMPPSQIAQKIGRSPRAVRVRMCRYRKSVRSDPKKRMVMGSIGKVLKALKQADIMREVEN